MRLDLPESNVADVIADVVVNVVVNVVADVVDVSSVEADNPPKQLRMAITAILTVRSNIFTDKREKTTTY